MNMQASEKLFLQTVGRFVKQWTAPLFERMEKVEAAVTAPATFTLAQEKIVKGLIDDALTQFLVTGKIATLDDIHDAIEKIEIPAPVAVSNGMDGKDGRDGKDVDMDVVADVIKNAVAIEVANIPKPKDGRDGVDGSDGKSVTADDLRDVIRDAVANAVATMPDSVGFVGAYIDRAGNLFLTTNRGGAVEVGHVVGKDADPAYIDAKISEAIKAASEKYPPPKDGKDGKDGRDGFSLTDFSVEQDGDRKAVLKFASGDVTQAHTLVFPVTIYRGVWRDGVPYERGDEVTRDGSQWIALKDTANMPPHDDWQMACRKGRDGKEGKPGPQGAPGKDGRDGRDLTQMGPDGRKW